MHSRLVTILGTSAMFLFGFALLVTRWYDVVVKAWRWELILASDGVMVGWWDWSEWRLYVGEGEHLSMWWLWPNRIKLPDVTALFIPWPLLFLAIVAVWLVAAPVTRRKVMVAGAFPVEKPSD